MPPKPPPDNVLPFRKREPGMPRFTRPKWLPPWLFSTATGWLIIVNTAIWLGMVVACLFLGAPGAGLWAPFPGSLTFLLGANYPPVDVAQPWRLVTSAFLHAGLFHVGMNMLMLWYLGLRLESAFGAARYLVLYMASALGGALVSFGWHLLLGGSSVGASGAIMGVLGGLFALSWKGLGFRHPMTRQWWMFAILGIGLGIVSSLLGTDALDNAAHIGGWGAGIGLALLFAGKRPWSAAAQKAAIAASILLVVASFGAALAVPAAGPGLSEKADVKEYNEAVNAGDWKRAEKILAPMLLANPESVDLHIRHAVLLDHLEQKDAATAELLAASKLDASAEDLGTIGELLFERGEVAAAQRCVKIAQVKDPGNPKYPALLKEMSAGPKP